MIEREKYNYKHNLPAVEKEYVECENIEDIKKLSKYKDDKIKYIGAILRKNQIENLAHYGNTVIANSMLEELGNDKIIKEVKRLTGLKCFITVLPSGTVLLIRA